MFTLSPKFMCLAMAASLIVLSCPAQADSTWRDSVSTTSSTMPLTDPSSLDSWSVTVGAGLGFSPRYSGSDRIKLNAIPVATVSYDHGFFYAGTQGIGMTPLRGENYDVRFGLGFDGGRYVEDDRRNLGGLNKITYSILGMVAGDYTFRTIKGSVNIQTALTGDYGTTMGLGLGTQRPLTESLSVMGNVHARLADGEHMHKFYGVTRKEAAASGKKYYEADAGIESYGLTLGLPYTIMRGLTLTPSLTADFLAGDAVDSPINASTFQPSGRVVATYSF